MDFLWRLIKEWYQLFCETINCLSGFGHHWGKFQRENTFDQYLKFSCVYLEEKNKLQKPPETCNYKSLVLNQWLQSPSISSVLQHLRGQYLELNALYTLCHFFPSIDSHVTHPLALFSFKYFPSILLCCLIHISIKNTFAHLLNSWWIKECHLSELQGIGVGLRDSFEFSLRNRKPGQVGRTEGRCPE